MGTDPKTSEPAVPKGDHVLIIIVKSVGIAAVLVGVAWAVTAMAFKYF